MNLAGGVVVGPLNVEVVLAVLAALDRLPRRLRESMAASDHLEVVLRYRLDATARVQDGLDDQRAMAAWSAARQRIAQVAWSDDPLLYAGQDDRPGASFGRPWRPARGVNQTPLGSRSARCPKRVDVCIRQHRRPVEDDVTSGRLVRALSQD